MTSIIGEHGFHHKLGIHDSMIATCSLRRREDTAPHLRGLASWAVARESFCAFRSRPQGGAAMRNFGSFC